MRTSKKYHHMLLSAILLLLLIPIIPIDHFFPSLKASFPKGGKLPEFKEEAWFSGKYQEDWNEHAKNDINFSDFFLRLNNQINYSIFSKSTSNDFFVGNEGYLFAQKHLDAVTGEYFLGDDYIKNKVKRLKMVQDTLSKKGVKLLYIHQPSRGKLFEDKIPKFWLHSMNENHDVDVMNKYFKAYDVNYLDMHNYVLSLKENYKIFPKLGNHPCKLVDYILIDTLISRCEDMTNVHVPHFKIVDQYQEYAKSTPFVDIASGAPTVTETELEHCFKLLVSIEHEKLWYPKIEVDSCIQPKLKVLGISDSFFLTAFNSHIFTKVFKEGTLSYYNNHRYKEGEHNLKKVESSDLRADVEKYDLLLLSQTASNQKFFGFGAIDALYISYFVPEEDREEEWKIAETEIKILTTHKWFKSVLFKSRENGKGFEKELRNNAIYTLKHS